MAPLMTCDALDVVLHIYALDDPLMFLDDISLFT